MEDLDMELDSRKAPRGQIKLHWLSWITMRVSKIVSKSNKDKIVALVGILMQSLLASGGLMEDLDNKWILNATSINQDCREKDGNNPVTLGLENMRGVSDKGYINFAALCVLYLSF